MKNRAVIASGQAPVFLRTKKVCSRGLQQRVGRIRLMTTISSGLPGELQQPKSAAEGEPAELLAFALARPVIRSEAQPWDQLAWHDGRESSRPRFQPIGLAGKR